MKLKNFFIATCVALTPLALFWGCNKAGQPVAPANGSGFTINLLNPSAQFVGAAQNTILYNISGSGAPVTGSYGPLSSAAVTGAISFNVPLPGATSSYSLISIQINNTSTGVPLALGAAPFSTTSAGISVELGPMNRSCYEVTNFPEGYYYYFQNSSFSIQPTDIECVVNSNSTGYELDALTSITNGIAYMGNGNLVNFDSVPLSANFKTQSSASKEFVKTGSTTSPQSYPVALNDVYCVRLLGGGYAWLQITNAGSFSASTGPSFVFRLNTTLPYFAYQQSTSDLSGACGIGSLITPTPTPYAPAAISVTFTSNVYGIALYPSTAAAISIFVANDPMVNPTSPTNTAFIQVLNPTTLSASTTFASGSNWVQGMAVNSAATTLYAAETYSQGAPSVQVYSLASLQSSGTVGNGIPAPPIAVTPGVTPGPDLPGDALLGEMAAPEFLAVAPNSGTYPNGLFVTDSGTNGIANVLVFSNAVAGAAAVTYWNGQIGTSTSPTGIATDGVTIYVADSGHNQIETYNVNGVAGNSWTTDNNPAGSKAFSGPQGIAVDTVASPELLFIADTNNNRVVEMTTAGAFKASWGTWGLGTTGGNFNLPVAIAVDGASPPDVYVADSGNKRVLKFLGL